MSELNHRLFVAAAQHTMQEVIERYGTQEDMQGRRGAYVCVAENSLPIHTFLVGVVPDQQKRKKYSELAAEKCARVFRMNALHRDITSRESADFEAGLYPGAVMANNRRSHGMSGLPADLDELCSSVHACIVGDLSDDEAEVRLSDNPYKGDFFFVLKAVRLRLADDGYMR